MDISQTWRTWFNITPIAEALRLRKQFATELVSFPAIKEKMRNDMNRILRTTEATYAQDFASTEPSREEWLQLVRELINASYELDELDDEALCESCHTLFNIYETDCVHLYVSSDYSDVWLCRSCFVAIVSTLVRKGVENENSNRE